MGKRRKRRATEAFEVIKGGDRVVNFQLISNKKLRTVATKKNLSLSDFKQGDIKNCGLISPLAALSQRDEYYEDIAPKVENEDHLSFNIFLKGTPTKILVNKSLPFDENMSLVYAQSNKDILSIAAFFEKVFVKCCCNYKYDNCKYIPPNLVFRTFSRYMTSFRQYEDDDHKEDLMTYIVKLFEKKSSAVIGISPDLSVDLNVDNEDDYEDNHMYFLENYNVEHNAIKLYDPACSQEFCINNGDLPQWFQENSDVSNGSYWIKLEQLEKRSCQISSLHHKDYHKIIKSFTMDFAKSEFDKLEIQKNVCTINTKTESSVSVNYFCISHEPSDCDILVFNEKGEEVSIDFDLPYSGYTSQCKLPNEPKLEMFQEFNLKAGIFTLAISIKLEKKIKKKFESLLRVASKSFVSISSLKSER